jgi:hypothetical protein
VHAAKESSACKGSDYAHFKQIDCGIFRLSPTGARLTRLVHARGYKPALLVMKAVFLIGVVTPESTGAMYL